jgi:hypothetical protein
VHANGAVLFEVGPRESELGPRDSNTKRRCSAAAVWSAVADLIKHSPAILCVQIEDSRVLTRVPKS